MITTLEKIAEEFAKANEVQLLDVISENNETTPNQVRYIRKTEGIGRNYFFLEYTKEYEKEEDKNKFVGESLSISNNAYMLSVNAGIRANYDIEVTPKRLIEAVASARAICSFGAGLDYCKSSKILLPSDEEGPEALKELIRMLFK